MKVTHLRDKYIARYTKERTTGIAPTFWGAVERALVAAERKERTVRLRVSCKCPR